MDKLLYDIKGAIAVTSLSRSTLYVLMAEGKLRPVKIGRSLRFSADELRAFVERLKAEAEAEASTTVSPAMHPLVAWIMKVGRCDPKYCRVSTESRDNEVLIYHVIDGSPCLVTARIFEDDYDKSAESVETFVRLVFPDHHAQAARRRLERGRLRHVIGIDGEHAMTTQT